MRSVKGTIILSFVINRAIFSELLKACPNYTPESIESLVDPADHQNVPRAVRLLQAIVVLGKINASKLDISDRAKLRPIKLLAALWAGMQFCLRSLIPASHSRSNLHATRGLPILHTLCMPCTELAL